LSFFEAVILDALVRGGAREALILSDIRGARMALSEEGARRVGRDYEMEPLAVRGGVFHPKISVLTAENECHILVGSGNLTFGGWGGNLEIVEHLHPGSAPDAIEDTAAFFDQLATTHRIRHGARDRCAAIADELRTFAAGRTRTGAVRLIHSLDGAIAQQISQIAVELGGAVRLTVASPFWDDGSTIDRLCVELGLSEICIHAHDAGSVQGMAGSNWPSNAATKIHPVRLDIMSQDERLLHAKVFELQCKRGRLLVSGSANATAAALAANHNVEVCVARIQREPVVGWTFSAAEKPDHWSPSEADAKEDSAEPGVLRATLTGERIEAQVLSPAAMTGEITVARVSTEGVERLGSAALDENAAFSVEAPGIEAQFWKGGRLVLRVENDLGRRAEGFVAVASFAEITRRAGPLAGRLLAVLAGTETPEDVAAILSWFHEDPRRLSGHGPAGIGGADGEANDGRRGETSRMIAVDELDISYAVPIPMNVSDAGGGTSWRRFMEHVFSAFRERRGPFRGTTAGRVAEDEDDDETAKAPGSALPDPAVERSLQVFERLFKMLVSAHNQPHHAITAFDLTQYVCERLQPSVDLARNWLERLLNIITQGPIPQDRREDVAAAVLVLLASEHESPQFLAARARLIRLSFPLSGGSPSPERARGFQSVLPERMAYIDAWEHVLAVRTYPEQIRSYLNAMETGQPLMDCADLPNVVPEEWRVLEQALHSTQSRSKIRVLKTWSNACPTCNMMLPTGEISKLRSIGVASAKNCCGRVILYVGK